MTDHSIPRRPKAASGAALTTLGAFLGVADDRAIGLAYAERGEPRARSYLLRATPRDWPVQLRLAVLEPDPVKAVALYEAVVRDNPGETAALVNLGSLYAQAGRTADAARLWTRALESNPATEEAVLNLSLIRPPDEARAILQHYLEFNPVSRKARERLASLSNPPRKQ
jgi:tetratricopeptide (TPR) repeat protein